ncbi:MAG: HAD-IA family hydrolase [Eubacterium sp.]|nr:HAD-IA family hydrolase [Eubacterium sp.]
MYQAVIFDLDGTLLNTIDDLANAVRFVQRKFGWAEDSTEVVQQHVGNGIRNLIIRSTPEGEENPLFEDAFLSFKEYYQQHCEEQTDLYPGIRELLETLKRKNIKMAIVSNKAHPAVLKLHDTYFKDYLDVVYGENEDAGIQKKPAPDMVKLAMERLGVTASETVYVGDSDVDKATADNSGLDCILCEWGFRELSLLKSLKPKAIIAEPLELIKLVQV